MNEGVKILLERIKTHPEEFTQGGRWVKFLYEYNDILPEELEPLKTEIRKLVAEQFTKEVMKELLDAEPDQLELHFGMERLRKKQQDELHRKWVEMQTTYGRLKYDAIEES